MPLSRRSRVIRAVPTAPISSGCAGTITFRCERAAIANATDLLRATPPRKRSFSPICRGPTIREI